MVRYSTFILNIERVSPNHPLPVFLNVGEVCGHLLRRCLPARARQTSLMILQAEGVVGEGQLRSIDTLGGYQ